MAAVRTDEGLTPVEHTVMGVVLAFEGIVGITTSGYRLMSLLGNKTGDRILRNLRISLAIGDLAIGLMCPVVAIASFLQHWPYGPGGCQAYAFVANLFGLVSIWSLTAMVCYLVINSGRADAKKDELRSRYSTAIPLIWAGALFWAATPLPFIGWGRYVVEPFGTGCLLDFADRSPSYFLYLLGYAASGLGFPIALLVSHGLGAQNATSESVTACWKAVMALSFYWACYGAVAIISAISGSGSIPLGIFALAPLMAKTCPVVNSLLFGESSASDQSASAIKEQKKH